MYLSGLIAHLRTLIADEALDFVFQPIFDLHRRDVLDYETLVADLQTRRSTPERIAAGGPRTAAWKPCWSTRLPPNWPQQPAARHPATSPGHGE